MMTSKPRAGSSSGGGERVRSLDRQITALDLDCLREAFALFGAEREEAITTEELGKVRATQALEHGFAISGAVNRILRNFTVLREGPTGLVDVKLGRLTPKIITNKCSQQGEGASKGQGQSASIIPHAHVSA